MSNRDAIKVVCRIRPENLKTQLKIKESNKGGYKRCVVYDDTKIEVDCNPDSKVSDMSGKHKFTFDAIFGPDSRQH